jgi:hypothetical protein
MRNLASCPGRRLGQPEGCIQIWTFLNPGERFGHRTGSQVRVEHLGGRSPSGSIGRNHEARSANAANPRGRRPAPGCVHRLGSQHAEPIPNSDDDNPEHRCAAEGDRHHSAIGDYSICQADCANDTIDLGFRWHCSVIAEGPGSSQGSHSSSGYGSSGHCTARHRPSGHCTSRHRPSGHCTACHRSALDAATDHRTADHYDQSRRRRGWHRVLAALDNGKHPWTSSQAIARQRMRCRLRWRRMGR